MERDGKPVPYERMTINSPQFDTVREMRTPPGTSVRTGATPLVNAGGKASNRPRTLTARQIPI